MKFLWVVDSHKIITTTILCCYFTFFKHYTLTTIKGITDATSRGRLYNCLVLESMLLRRPAASRMFIFVHKFFFISGLLSSSSPVLLGQAVLQCAYKISEFFSNFTNFPVCFFHSLIICILGGPQCFFTILLQNHFIYLIVFTLTPAVYKIIVCLLDILKTNLSAVSSVSLHATEKFV